MTDDSAAASAEFASGTSTGARFWAVDLHVHTPASADVQRSRYGEATPESIVSAAMEAGLDAIAITDHNTAEWCDDVSEAAAETPLVVLPGVEISTAEGHLLAVFEEGTPGRQIEDLLVSAGIASDDHGRLDITSTDGFAKTAETIGRAGAIAIAAHIDRDKGVLSLEVGATRKTALQCPAIHAFEFVDEDTVLTAQRKAGNRPAMAFVRGSDSMIPGEDGHRLRGIGQRRTWIKAGRPDLVGLRHAFRDPDLRTRLDTPKPVTHSFVKSLSTTGGFLGDVVVSFSPDLTCLLGGTGTGKSLVLELVRFALDQQTDRSELESIREEVDRRLEFALGTDSSVSLIVSTPDGDLEIRRAYAGANSPPPEIVDQPDAKVSEVVPIKAFSQGEVIEYARTPVGRMLLIDSNLDLSGDLKREADLILELDRNGRQIVELQAACRSTKELIENLSDKDGRLKELSKLFDADVVKEQEHWSAEQAAFKAFRESIPAVGELSVHLDMAFEESASLESNADLFSEASNAVAQLKDRVSKSNIKMEKARKRTAKTLDDVEKEWLDRRAAATKKLNKALSGVDSTDEKDLAALRATLGTLQTRQSERKQLKKKLRKKLRPRLRKVLQDREELISELLDARQNRRERRKERIESLNTLMAGVVRMKLVKETEWEQFSIDLREIARGSSLRALTLQKLAENTLPLKLVRSYLLNDAKAVASVTDVSEEQVQKLFDHASDSQREEDMISLQHVELRDTLSIEFRPDGADSRYQPIERLAHGQKCTAILIVALADGTEPLIIDQPEDALHAPWIEDHLVERLRSLRGDRQFLFASRSPGLVVSADADLVVTLVAHAESGRIEASGSLERLDLNRLALYHLEGGPVPFARRTSKFERSIADPA